MRRRARQAQRQLLFLTAVKCTIVKRRREGIFLVLLLCSCTFVKRRRSPRRSEDIFCSCLLCSASSSCEDGLSAANTSSVPDCCEVHNRHAKTVVRCEGILLVLLLCSAHSSSEKRPGSP